MANSINYAAVFNRILDEKFYIMPRTLWMENTTPGMVYEGGKYIKVPIMETDGLGDMQNGRAPSGDLVLDWETKELEYHRGRSFEILQWDPDMTNFALTVSNVMNVFMREQAVPELDKIRIGRVSIGAVNYGSRCVKAQSTAGITSANVLGLLLDDIATVQDRIGETEQLFIQISTKMKNLLQNSTQIQKYLNVRDFSIRSITTRIEAINDQYMIGTPSGYMHSVFRLNDGRTSGQTVGGVAFTDLGPGINWIISSRRAVDAIAKPQITKMIDPMTNQEGQFWKIIFDLFHGVWTFDNKKDGLLVNMDTTLPTFTVSSEAGTESVGDSVITTTAAFDKRLPAKLVWKAASGTAPSVTFGTALTTANGWADLPADGLISTTNAYKITVALVARDSLLPLAYGSGTVVAKAS